MKTKQFNWKKTLLATLLIIGGTTATFAQCDKEVTLTASTTTYLNAKGEVERTVNEETIISISKTQITIVPGDHDPTSGNVKTFVCNWKVPFKEGKSVITGLLVDGGHEMNATITVEGKDGKVTLTFEAAEMPGKKIRVVADKFE
jgi:hypothetical protein